MTLTLRWGKKKKEDDLDCDGNPRRGISISSLKLEFFSLKKQRNQRKWGNKFKNWTSFNTYCSIYTTLLSNRGDRWRQVEWGWSASRGGSACILSSAFRKHFHILPLCSPSQVRWNFRTPTRTCPMSSSTTRRRPACLCCSRASMETCPSPRGC